MNRVQSIRKDHGLEVTDRIQLTLHAADEIRATIEGNLDYIRLETLADEIQWQDANDSVEVELGDGIALKVGVEKLN